jgi:hypothetical protein
MQRRQRYSVKCSDCREQQGTRKTGIPDPFIFSCNQTSSYEHVKENPGPSAVLSRDRPGADDGNGMSVC